MLIESLIRYHKNSEQVVDGCTDRKADWVICLDLEGRWLQIVDQRFKKTKKKKGEIPQEDPRIVFRAPNLSRSSDVNAILLFDKPAYVFGGEGRDEKAHHDFIQLIRVAYNHTQHPHLQAILRAYQEHNRPEVPMMGKDDWITFMVDGVYPIQDPAIRNFWLYWVREGLLSSKKSSKRTSQESTATMYCLACNQPCEPLHKHGHDFPMPSEKRTKLVSANQASEATYGWSQSLNSPMCQSCVEAYGMSLQRLLARDSRHRLRYGNQIGVFWIEKTTDELEEDDWNLLDSPKVDQVQSLLESIYGPTRYVNPTWDESVVQCWWLDNHKSRLFVRGGTSMSLTTLKKRIASFFRRQHVAGLGENTHWYGIPALAMATANPNQKLRDLPDHVFLSIARHIMEGRTLPLSILQQVVTRCRVEGGANRVRTAFLKLALTQNYPEKEETYSMLDLNEKHPAYLYGRLLVVFDELKYHAIKSKVSVSERSYGSASTGPVTTFSILIRDAQHHISKLYKTKPGLARRLQTDMENIIAMLPTSLPRTFDLEEQSMFGIGHYHQKHAYRMQSIEKAKEKKEGSHVS